MDGYDAIVVGSGYGGSVAACRLSMAGVKVCLLEKGDRWDAKDFPTNSFSIMSAVRMEWKRWGLGFGSKKALFQIYEQDSSVCAVACGLGGGSLVNAGVLISTPVQARRNPGWPKEWHKHWETSEASASAMLGAQNVPVQFLNSKVMKQIVEEEIEEYKADPIKLSINFGHPKADKSTGTQKMGSCVACGNCLSGCPYNAKNSTDKNYLASAIQAGCAIKTGCQVLYIVKNPVQNCGENNYESATRQRRWRVYFDNLDFLCADFVVLSAGVLGTAEILFQSERRGVGLSKRIGFGFSCNGNNVAYVAGSQAPLHAYGLNRKKLPNILFQDRPGPAISFSRTSSLGYTIQSGVLPTSYPYLLFKGIITYGWPNGYWFFHGLVDKLKHLMGFKDSQAMVLNVMGYDASDGRITFDEETEKICFKPPHDPLLSRKIQALQRLAKRLGGILFMSRYRSTSVHLLGGCNAGSDPSQGVCNPNGQVFDTHSGHLAVHEGLYICDASLIPCSVGINPCLTIATVAELVSRNLVPDVLQFKSRLQQNLKAKVSEDIEFIDKPLAVNGSLGPLNSGISQKVSFKETLRGFIGGMPCTAYLIIKMNYGYQKDCSKKKLASGEPHPLLRGKVGGYVVFPAVNKDKLFIIDGEVDMCKVDNRTPYAQYMHYLLILATASSSRYVLEGRKVMNPYLLASYAWMESRTLHVSFRELNQDDINGCWRSRNLNEQMVDLRGELYLSASELMKSFLSLKGNQRAGFVSLLLQSIWRTYILQIPRYNTLGPKHSDMRHTPYPQSILHELKTEDGFIISCQQWMSIPDTQKSEEERERYPVLLLNGHSAESYRLPTEPKDLVRTLLAEGYETWLLQTRLHPVHPSNNFTLDDIGRFDIPAVIAKIHEFHGSLTKIHVIAHCVGGLAIHIAILGGYISATHIASLSCTNSSMFFKLTTSALVKMRLPLIPASMIILGKNRIISMFDSPMDSHRHRLLKSIVRMIPRTECCTCKECELFSGIFGNAYWHENVSESMHHWINKQSLPRLPLAAFPHLRRICTSGFIVDAAGRNEYLVHPERMALPTLYVSGGRSLLVTPETTFLAHNYMKMHQPTFCHKRVVIDGFGHSDLLIGEEAHERVFPHFISHIRMVEKGEGVVENGCGKKDSALRWDGEHDGDGEFGGWGVLVFLIVLVFSILFHFSFLG